MNVFQSPPFKDGRELHLPALSYGVRVHVPMITPKPDFVKLENKNNYLTFATQYIIVGAEGENMDTLQTMEKDRAKELRIGLKRYIAGLTFPPKQVDMAKQMKISTSVLSVFLNRPYVKTADLVLNRIERFLSKQNGQK